MDKLGGINPGDATQYLDGVGWPADKSEVADKARSNGAPDGMVEKIRDSWMQKFSGSRGIVTALQD